MRHILGMFNLSLEYLGMELNGVLLPKASEKGEVKSQTHIMYKALIMGYKLIN